MSSKTKKEIISIVSEKEAKKKGFAKTQYCSDFEFDKTNIKQILKEILDPVKEKKFVDYLKYLANH